MINKMAETKMGHSHYLRVVRAVKKRKKERLVRELSKIEKELDGIENELKEEKTQ